MEEAASSTRCPTHLDPTLSVPAPMYHPIQCTPLSVPAYPQEFVWEASHYLVRQVFNSLQEMFSGTRAIQVCPPRPFPGVAPQTVPHPEPVPIPAALAGRKRAAHCPHWLGGGVGHAPGHPCHPALPPGCQGVGKCRPRPPPCPAPPPPQRRASLKHPARPTIILQINGGIQSLTFSNSGDTSQ